MGVYFAKVWEMIKKAGEIFISFFAKVWNVIVGADYRSKKTYYIPITLVISHLILLIGRYIYALVMVEGRIISNNVFYLLLACSIPFLFWVMSTMCEALSYGKIKRIDLWVCIINALFTIMQPLWSLLYHYVVIPIMGIKVDQYITAGMVLGLARIALLAPCAFVLWLIIPSLRKVLSGENFTDQLDSFRIDHKIDMRKNKKVAYDVKVMRDSKNYGEELPLYQEDLYTHLLLIGASGTGKTSSFLIPFIICILKTKVKNRKKRETELLKLVNEKKAYIVGPVAHPTEYDIVPFNKYKKEVKKIYKKYPDCGITCVSPNEALGNKIVELCGDCHIGVNMVDPTKSYSEEYVNQVGLKPFYVPFGLSEEDRAVMIINQAKVFSETLITVNEASEDGGGEKYFKDLNTSVTSNIAIICMLYANLKGRQTSYGEVQECINNFKFLYPMVKYINKVFNFGLNIADPYKLAEKKKSKDKESADNIETAGLAGAVRGEKQSNESQDGEKHYGELLPLNDSSDENVRTFKFACRYVNDELFYKGDVMYDQARGLRNLVNDMVAHPRVYKVLSGGDKFLDFDRTLSRCEITVINTGIAINQASSTGLGLFSLLNQKRAILRRPEGDRQPHFIIVDEATQYVHPWMEDAIGLYRQYGCSCTFAFQSLAQMEKTNKTKYIKGLLLTVGNIIVYGRVGMEEMNLFEIMGGTRKITQVQEQNSKTSIISDTPSATYGERYTETDESVSTGSSVRIRSFQEVTWIGSVKGDVQFAKIAKLSFPEEEPFAKIDTNVVNWAEYATKDGVIPMDPDQESIPETEPVEEAIEENITVDLQVAEKEGDFTLLAESTGSVPVHIKELQKDLPENQADQPEFENARISNFNVNDSSEDKEAAVTMKECEDNTFTVEEEATVSQSKEDLSGIISVMPAADQEAEQEDIEEYLFY